MQTLKSYLDHALLVWKDSTAAARFGIILLLVICFGAIVGVGIWSSRPQYVAVVSDSDAKTMTQMIAALEQANIPYKISTAGSGIRVSNRHYDEASMIARSLGVGSQVPELERPSPWTDPLVQQDARRRNLEAMLTSTIRKLDFVKDATVHLGIPDKQPFLRQRDEPKASVMLELMPNHAPTDGIAASIAVQVAGAVPGLRPDQVSITDSNGKVYSLDASLRQLTKQEEFRLNRERELRYKAQSLLNRVYGFGNSQVELNATYMFPDSKTTTTEVDPDKKVATRELVDSTETTGENAPAAGIAGVTPNLSSSSGNRKQKTVINKQEISEFEYQYSQIIREAREQTPELDVLTVSVLVNSDGITKDENQQIPAEAKSRIENMVKQAVGFRDGIDQFDLAFMPFAETIDFDAPAVTGFPWDKLNSILKNVSLGIAALVALLLGLKAIKNLQPVPVSGGTASSLPGERASQVSQLSEMVKQNPEVFSKIISAWANDSAQEADERQTQDKAA